MPYGPTAPFGPDPSYGFGSGSGRSARAVERALAFARYEASRAGAGAIDSGHLLVGLARLGEEPVAELLRRHGTGLDLLRRRLCGRQAESRQGSALGAAAELPLAAECAAILERTACEGASAPPGSPGSGCLLVGILAVPECRAAALLAEHGLEAGVVRRELAAAAPVASAGAEALAPALPLTERFTRDLTTLAEQGAFDPVVGREDELAQVVQILAQRSKRNPVLVGEPGVGKTAVVEGLAQRIAEGRVPAFLAGRRIVALDLGSLVAGTRYRGDFEERLEGVVAELRQAGDRIVFIDEIHALVGAGGGEGSMDAANLLKPALSRGEVAVIGATTPAEYRRHVERDRALERRFQAVEICPPTREQALEILAGVRERYEGFHGVVYRDSALAAAVDRAVRYLPERRLPDKALELLDRSGARVKLAAGAASAAPPSAAGAGAAEVTVAEVTPDDVDAVVAQATGIPVARLRSGEAERLRRMEHELGRRVVGQDEALAALARAVRRARLGVRDPRRPVGSFLFVGPSGVGKTETARALAQLLFDRDDALLRFDMSEYMERHTVARLLGAPPGYVGYRDGGALTEALRRRPYSVVLFDEIEKAHPDVADLLLQVFEEGRLTDREGNVADFSHAVVLLTSNVGVRQASGDGIGFAEDRQAAQRRARNELMAEVRRAFRPELLDRLDDVVVFQPLGEPELLAVLEMQLGELAGRCAARGVALEVGQPARRWLLDRSGAGAGQGARPLRRAVERWVQAAVSDALLDPAEPARLAVAVAEDGGALVAGPPQPAVAQAGRSRPRSDGGIKAVDTPDPGTNDAEATRC